jgi:DNA-directed RNA polymerase subunit RPC12/RpoP
MKINCAQCGAEHIVIESDFFLRCPYCDARIVVDPPADTPKLVMASVTEEYVKRLFPLGMVISLEKKYFPYYEADQSLRGKTLISCFSQPWQELEDYSPPAGDRRVFDESIAEPCEFIPFDRDKIDESSVRIVFHPFYIVMLKLEGYSEGVLVDAVSGLFLGESPVMDDTASKEMELRKLFFLTLIAGLAVSIPAFLFLGNMDISWLFQTWFFVLILLVIAIAIYVNKVKKK